IELCDDPAARSMRPMTLPIALRSSALTLDRSESGLGAWRAETALDTNASFDEDTDRFRFCVDVMPGDYSVVVTPPSGLPCKLFAEQRLIQAPDDEKATAALLQLANAATLEGTLMTFDSVPIPSAVIDLQSRGRSGTILLDEADASLTSYGRSRQ